MSWPTSSSEQTLRMPTNNERHFPDVCPPPDRQGAHHSPQEDQRRDRGDERFPRERLRVDYPVSCLHIDPGIEGIQTRSSVSQDSAPLFTYLQKHNKKSTTFHIERAPGFGIVVRNDQLQPKRVFPSLDKASRDFCLLPSARIHIITLATIQIVTGTLTDLDQFTGRHERGRLLSAL